MGAVGLDDGRPGAVGGSTGERVRAVVVPRPGAALSEADVRAHCKDRLARYKQPREVELVTALPRTALGKLARARLRSPTRRGESAARPAGIV